MAKNTRKPEVGDWVHYYSGSKEKPLIGPIAAIVTGTRELEVASQGMKVDDPHFKVFLHTFPPCHRAASNFDSGRGVGEDLGDIAFSSEPTAFHWTWKPDNK